MVLYIEGNLGKLTVWQGQRLLYRGDSPVVWVPLLKERESILRLVGEGPGGVGGGIYLVGRSDTIGWPVDTYPANPLISAEVKGDTEENRWVYLPAVPAVHSQKRLAQQGVLWKVGRPQTPSEPSSKSPSWLFFSLMGLAGISVVSPALRRVFWQGFYRVVPVGPVEAVAGMGITLLFAGLVWPGQLELFFLFIAYQVAEIVGVLLWGGSPHTAWQSWHPLLLGLLASQTFWPATGFLPLYVAWGLRSLRLSLNSPGFAYLCLAEAFLYFLLQST